MLGSFAVGKTSLVRQYVHSMFDERYHTTVGVKIDKKQLRIDERTIDLILWDLAGEEESFNVRSAYLQGAAGAVLVADGTRGETLDVALELGRKLTSEVGEVPVVLLVNKSDLSAAGMGAPDDVAAHKISAKTGEGLDALESWLEQVVNTRLSAREAPALSRARHREGVSRAHGHLRAALSQIAGAPELAAAEVHLGLRAIESLTGRIDVEDVLDQVFSQFCIGK